jgi:hypothetical protein
MPQLYVHIDDAIYGLFGVVHKWSRNEQPLIFGIVEDVWLVLVKQEKKHKNKVAIKDQKGRALNILL